MILHQYRRSVVVILSRQIQLLLITRGSLIDLIAIPQIIAGQQTATPFSHLHLHTLLIAVIGKRGHVTILRNSVRTLERGIANNLCGGRHNTICHARGRYGVRLATCIICECTTDIPFG